MTTPETAASLGEVDLFHGLSPRVLKKIADAGHENEYAPGTVVVSEGESVAGFKAFSATGVEMHVVTSGEAVVTVKGEAVATLGPGDYFGELSLIDGEPRSAGVTAGEGGLGTLSLTKWTFDDLVATHPEVALPMLRVMCARLRRTERAT